MPEPVPRPRFDNELSVRGFAGFTAGLLAGLLLVGVACRALTAGAEDDVRPLQSQPRPPAPRLQSDPAADLAADRERQRRLASAWWWCDASHRSAHVPAGRAQELVLERGLPAAEAEGAGDAAR